MTDHLDKLAAQREIGERIGVFAEAMHAAETPALRDLESQALEEGVPIIRPHTRGLIQCILEMKVPSAILEVGTAVGYSALVMHTYAPKPCRITTIETDPERAAQARDNFARFGADGITLMEGDAAEILQSLEGPFDFIFLDAAKGQYIHWLPDVIRLMHPGSLLVSDNVLQNGDLVQSHFLVERRKRTIYKRMREYLFALTHDPLLETVILPSGDGTALSVKLEETDE